MQKFALILLALLCTQPAWSHSVDHQVHREEGIVVTIQLGRSEARFADYEIFPPDSEIPFQDGRTDRHGRLSFLPDKTGTWTVKVKADSHHGIHGARVQIEVNDEGVITDLSQPLFATHTRLITGVSLLLGVFGLLALLRSRRPRGEGSAPRP